MKWRPRFKRRSPWGRKRQTNRTYQDQYIRDLILADTAEMGGTCSVRSLTKHKPGRYNQRYLKAALERLLKRLPAAVTKNLDKLRTGVQ